MRQSRLPLGILEIPIKLKLNKPGSYQTATRQSRNILERLKKNKVKNELKQATSTKSSEYRTGSMIDKRGEYDVSDSKSRYTNRPANAIRFASNEVVVKKEQLNYRTTLTGLKFKLSDRISVPTYRFELKDTGVQKIEAARQAVLAEITDIKETLGELKADIAEMEDYKKTLTVADKKREDELDREINAVRMEIDRMRANLERKRKELQLFNTLISRIKNTRKVGVSNINLKAIGAPPVKVYQPKVPDFKPPVNPGKPGSKNGEKGVQEDVSILSQPRIKIGSKETKSFTIKNKNGLSRSSSEIHKPIEIHRAKF